MGPEIDEKQREASSVNLVKRGRQRKTTHLADHVRRVISDLEEKNGPSAQGRGALRRSGTHIEVVEFIPVESQLLLHSQSTNFSSAPLESTQSDSMSLTLRPDTYAFDMFDLRNCRPVRVSTPCSECD